MRYIGGYSPLINLLLTYWDKDTQQKKSDKNGESLELVGNGGLFWWSGSVSQKKVETEKPTLKKIAKEVTSESEETKKADSPTFVAHGRNHSYPKKVEEQKDSQQRVCSSQGIHHRTTQQFAQGISKLPWQSCWAEGLWGADGSQFKICLSEVVDAVLPMFCYEGNFTNDHGPWIIMWHGDPDKNVFSKQNYSNFWCAIEWGLLFTAKESKHLHIQFMHSQFVKIQDSMR